MGFIIALMQATAYLELVKSERQCLIENFSGHFSFDGYSLLEGVNRESCKDPESFLWQNSGL